MLPIWAIGDCENKLFSRGRAAFSMVDLVLGAVSISMVSVTLIIFDRVL